MLIVIIALTVLAVTYGFYFRSQNSITTKELPESWANVRNIVKQVSGLLSILVGFEFVSNITFVGNVSETIDLLLANYEGMHEIWSRIAIMANAFYHIWKTAEESKAGEKVTNAFNLGKFGTANASVQTKSVVKCNRITDLAKAA